jgi:hypothetical protein
MGGLRFWVALCVGLSCSGIGVSQTVVLHLRNGDRVSGSLIGQQGGQITVSNAIFGRIVVPLTQVERQTTNGGAVVAIAATPALTPAAQRRLNELLAAYLANQISPAEFHRQRSKLVADGSSRITAGPPVINGVPAPALVNPAVTAKPPTGSPPAKVAPKYWSGEALLGADLAFSEKDRQLYTGRLKLGYARPPLRSAFDYLATYGRTDGDVSANRMDASAKVDYDINRRMYVYSLAAGGYDEIRKIDWRYEVGPGVGKRLIQLTNLVLNAEAGLNYQVQYFEGGRREDLFHYRLAEELKWNMGAQFTFDEKLEFLPRWNDLKQYKMRFEANLRYWLRANLSLNLTVIDTYDTVTATGVEQNDLQVRSSIGVKF